MYYISRRTFKKFFRGQLTGNWKGILDGLNEAIELAFIDAEEEEKNVIDEDTGGLTSEGADIVLGILIDFCRDYLPSGNR